MLDRSDFSAPEWYTLQSAILGTERYVQKASPNFYGDIKEGIVAKRVIKKFADDNASLLISELINFENYKSVFSDGAEANARSLEAPLMSVLSKSIDIIDKRSPTEADLFKSLILDLAYSIARARIKISDEEAKAIRKIAIAMETPPLKARHWDPNDPLV